MGRDDRWTCWFGTQMAPSALSNPRLIAVFGYGNVSRADDGLGPKFIDLLEQESPAHRDWPELHLVAAHQLQPEHVLDLAGCDAALFVDAAVDGQAPFALRAVSPAAARSWSTHSLEPAQLLAVYQETLAKVPPPSLLIEIAATDFSFAEMLSPSAQANLGGAVAFVDGLLVALHQADEDVLERRRNGRDVLHLDSLTL